MTEEAIILDTLRFIKRETNPPTHVNITDKIWWNFDLKRQEDLREVLRSTTMINYNQFNHWEFQLRSEAYPIIKDANKKLESDFLKSLQRQRNIELFMCNNFIKPNPKYLFFCWYKTVTLAHFTSSIIHNLYQIVGNKILA